MVFGQRFFDSRPYLSSGMTDSWGLAASALVVSLLILCWAQPANTSKFVSQQKATTSGQIHEVPRIPSGENPR
jgi:hypothetical protein